MIMQTQRQHRVTDPDGNQMEVIAVDLDKLLAQVKQEQEHGRLATAYSSFSKLPKLIERHYVENYVPSVFGPEEFGDVSKGTVAAERLALKALHLVNDDWEPTPLYMEAVSRGDDGRRELFNKLGRVVYAEMVDLARRDGTQEELEELFLNRSLAGSTMQKAVSFYAHYSEYAHLPWSSRFHRMRRVAFSYPTLLEPIEADGDQIGPERIPARLTRVTTERTVRSSSGPVVRSSSGLATTSESAPSTEDMRNRYIAMLLSVAEKSFENGEPSADILNRLERLLGFSEAPSE